MDDHTAASSRLAKDKGALYSDIPVAETLLDGFGWISIADHFIKTEANRRAWITLRFKDNLRDLR